MRLQEAALVIDRRKLFVIALHARRVQQRAVLAVSELESFAV
jgi:hypothetical protein